MGLVSVDAVSARNVCGHCGCESLVKMEDMVITSDSIVFPPCSWCLVASDNYLLSVVDSSVEMEMCDDARQRWVAVQTLYKRSMGSASRSAGFDKFPSDPELIRLADGDDTSVLRPPLHSSISRLRDKWIMEHGE